MAGDREQELRERYDFLRAWRGLPENPGPMTPSDEDVDPIDQCWADIRTLFELLDEAHETARGVEAIGKGVLGACETWMSRTEALRGAAMAVIDDGHGYCDHVENVTAEYEETAGRKFRGHIFRPKLCGDIEKCLYCRLRHLATEDYEV